MCTYIVHRNIAHIPGSKPKKKNKKINDFSLNRWELQCRITHNQSETNEQRTNEQQQILVVNNIVESMQLYISAWLHQCLIKSKFHCFKKSFAQSFSFINRKLCTLNDDMSKKLYVSTSIKKIYDIPRIFNESNDTHGMWRNSKNGQLQLNCVVVNWKSLSYDQRMNDPREQERKTIFFFIINFDSAKTQGQKSQASLTWTNRSEHSLPVRQTAHFAVSHSYWLTRHIFY